MKTHWPAIFSGATCLSLVAAYFGIRGLNLDNPSIGDTLLLLVGVAGGYSFPFLWFISLVLVVKHAVENRAIPYVASFLFLVASVTAMYGLMSGGA